MPIYVWIVVAFASGAVWAGAVAWFFWIFQERRTLRIQTRMFDEAAKWARASAESSRASDEPPDSVTVTAFMPVPSGWYEVRQ